MKKLMLVVGALALGFAANAECTWSWWTGGKDADKDLRGCQLGLASECKTMRGAQIGLTWSRMKNLHNGAQVSVGYNNAVSVQNGAQCAFVNIADRAALQIGLLCFNKEGFLPFFVFFNFDKKMFGGGERK